jgi:hypothetical protein
MDRAITTVIRAKPARPKENQSQTQIQPNTDLIQQSPAKLKPRKSFVFLRRIEPYQGVTPTLQGLFFICARLPAWKRVTGDPVVSFPMAAKRTIGNP